jgi:hypothetical protein
MTLKHTSNDDGSDPADGARTGAGDDARQTALADVAPPQPQMDLWFMIAQAQASSRCLLRMTDGLLPPHDRP